MKDFSQIRLSKAELKLLRSVKSSSAPFPDEHYERLMQHDFIEPSEFPSEGRIKMIATDRGIDYLAFADSLEASERKNRRHEWLIAIFSTFGGAFLSAPLWDLVHWLWQFLR